MASTHIVTFTGDGAVGNWSDPANWSGDKLPGQHTALNAVENGTSAFDTLMMLGTETITVNGTIDTNATGASQSFMICQNGTVVLTPSAAFHSDGGFLVGVNGHGTVIAEGTGATRSSITSVIVLIGQHTAGVGSVTIDDAVWHNTGSTTAGNFNIGEHQRVRR